MVISTPAISKKLVGGIYYNVDTARTLAFENVDRKIDMSPYEKYLYDENKEENLKALSKGKKKYKNRYLTLYSDSVYTISYNYDRYKNYCYSVDGKLEYLEVRQSLNLPSKRISYDLKGNLDSIILDVTSEEQLIFSANKKLVAHWIGKNCYDEKGELILTRD